MFSEVSPANEIKWALIKIAEFSAVSPANEIKWALIKIAEKLALGRSLHKHLFPEDGVGGGAHVCS